MDSEHRPPNAPPPQSGPPPQAGHTVPATGSAPADNDSDAVTRELVARAQGGDLQAFDQLVTLHRSTAFSMTLAILRNEHDAWDASQEGFVRAWRALGRFRGESSFSTWLYRIMSNAALDFLRRAKARRTIPFDEAFSPDDPAVGDALLKSGGASPADTMRLSEIRTRINQALDQLSADHRAAILLHEVEGLQYHEISERLSISIGTVMSRLFYARKKLQKLLGDLYENER